MFCVLALHEYSPRLVTLCNPGRRRNHATEPLVHSGKVPHPHTGAGNHETLSDYLPDRNGLIHPRFGNLSIAKSSSGLVNRDLVYSLDNRNLKRSMIMLARILCVS